MDVQSWTLGTHRAHMTDRPCDIDSFALLLAERTPEVEERLLSAGFWFPEVLHDAAREHGLTNASFAHDQHGFLFATLCLAVENGTRLRFEDIRKLAKEHGVVFNENTYPDELEWLLYLEVVDPVVIPNDFSTGTIHLYAMEVADLARKRDRIRNLLGELWELLDGDLEGLKRPPKTTAKPDSTVIIPKHIRRQLRRACVA